MVLDLRGLPGGANLDGSGNVTVTPATNLSAVHQALRRRRAGDPDRQLPNRRVSRDWHWAAGWGPIPGMPA